MKKEFFVLPLAFLALLSLLPLNAWWAPALDLGFSASPALNRMAAGQLLTLAVVALVLLLVRVLNPEGFRKYWGLGDWAAPAEAVRWLGIKNGESWTAVGRNFAVVMTLATAAFMYAGVYSNTPIDWLGALPWVLLFSATNSFSEEMLARFSLAAGLDGVMSKPAVCLWSAAIFGGLHYFGTPGGPIGVLMAGFLGWLLAKSVLESRGFGWAWLLHFLQDLAILFALLGSVQ